VTLPDYSLWFLEFSLELFGAHLSIKRKLWPLAIYLGFRAAADLIDASILVHYGARSFYIADLIQRTIQYPLMAILVLYCAGHILNEVSGKLKLYAAAGAAVALKAAVIYHAAVPLTCANLLKFELWANMALCGILSLALATAEEKLGGPWKVIALGVIVQTCSEWVLTMGMLGGIDTAKLYPFGALPALLAFCFAGKGTWKVSALRIDLGSRFEPDAVEEIRGAIQ